MKFKVRKTHNEEYLIPDDDDYEVIEINTLEEFLQFCKDSDEEVIVLRPEKEIGTYLEEYYIDDLKYDACLEIYNGYRE